MHECFNYAACVCPQNENIETFEPYSVVVTIAYILFHDCSSDGVARLFTTASERKAIPQELLVSTVLITILWVEIVCI